MRYLILPRGINVGKHNRIPMAELKTVLTTNGYTNVSTLLASGNILLESTKTETQVHEHIRGLLQENFGTDVAVLIRNHQQLQEIVDQNPSQRGTQDGSKYLVVFFDKEPAPEKAAALGRQDFAPEEINLRGRQAYVWVPHGVAGSKLSYQRLEKMLGVNATARNWNTVTKLLQR